MSQGPDDRARGDRPDPEPKIEAPEGSGPDLHPAVDPREVAEPEATDDRIEAPPVDIDERQDASRETHTPDVIALPDHGEDASPDGNVAVATSPDGSDTTTAPIGPAPPLEAREPGDTLTVVISKDQEHGTPPPDSQPGPPLAGQSPTVSSRMAEVASKLGLGRLLQTSDRGEDPTAEGTGSRAEPTTGPTGRRGAADRLAEGVRTYLDPRLHVGTAIPHRRVLAAGAVLILLSLLANSGGLASILLSAIVPVLIVLTLTRHDVFEKESNLLVAAVGLGGALVGIVISLLSSWIHSSQWFDRGVLNYGAAGFGGRFADAAGAAPFVVWLMVGLVFPVLALAGIAGIPIVLRRWPQFRNEVMDGMILVGASAAGFAIGASVVYWWPMIGDLGPQTDVSDWTLTIVGVAVLRTAVIALCGAMVGAGIWRYMIAPSDSMAVLPAVGGAIGYVLLTFGSVQLQPAGLWPELLWVALLLAAIFVLYRRVLDAAVATDRMALGRDQGRLVCPSCHRVTPAGAFCARCGQPLPSTGPASTEKAEQTR